MCVLQTYVDLTHPSHINIQWSARDKHNRIEVAGLLGSPVSPVGVAPEQRDIFEIMSRLELKSVLYATGESVDTFYAQIKNSCSSGLNLYTKKAFFCAEHCTA